MKFKTIDLNTAKLIVGGTNGDGIEPPKLSRSIKLRKPKSTKAKKETP